MFDTLLIIILFLVASLLVCLLTSRLNINIKHLCLFFHPSLILTYILKFRTHYLFRPLRLLRSLKSNSMVAKLGRFQIIFLGSSINKNQIIPDKSITFIVENNHIKYNNEVKPLELPMTKNLLLQNK